MWVGKRMAYNGGGLTAIKFCSSVNLFDSFPLTALAHYSQKQQRETLIRILEPGTVLVQPLSSGILVKSR